MTERSNSRNIAMGLLGVCFAALLVGVFNAAGTVAAGQGEEGKEKKGSPMLSLLKNSALKAPHLMLVEVTGPIMMESGQDKGLFPSESMAVTARKALEKAAKDNSVKGVLLRIDSPGGTVGMSQELNMAVQRVSKVKPVVASLGDLTASGGYYTACAADKIIANPGTLTGSIGVIISNLNLKGLLVDKLGLKPMTIKSGKFKDILSPMRETSPEELAMLQHMVDTSYQQFLNAVTEGRTRFISDPVKKQELAAKIKSVADGRILVSTEAKQMGLVDEIGDMTDARKVLDRMAKERFNLRGKDELPLMEYSDSKTVLEWLGIEAAFGARPSRAEALSSLLPMSMTRPNQPLWIME